MLKLIEPENYFKRYIVAILFFCLIDVVALFLNVKLPLGILYGPLLYLGSRDAIGRRSVYAYLHIMPFLLFLFAYVFVHLGKQFLIVWISNFHESYNQVYNLVLPVSLFSYGVIVLFHKKNNIQDAFVVKGINAIYLISSASIVVSVIMFIRLTWVNFSFNADFVMYCFLGITVSILSYYLFFLNYQLKKHNAFLVTAKRQFCSDLNPDEFKTKLYECLEDKKLFLKAGLTLDLLAEKTGLTKHQLSYFLNTYVDKSFYKLLAEYRISYAKKRLSEDRFVTIETLAYECGFSSKTTLNKYFKEFTGFAPSQYRSGISLKQL